MLKRALAVILISIVSWMSVDAHANSSEIKISRKFIVEDIKQLAMVIESSHPDPYSHGGGKIEFHRRLHQLIKNVPEEGMTARALWAYLLPFIAAVRDCHTSLMLDKSDEPGLPLVFDVIEEELIVSGVGNNAYLPLVGAKLTAIENLTFPQLLERQKSLWGWRTDYDNLNHLKQFLFKRDQIKLLIPEWNIQNPLQSVFTLPNGSQKSYEFILDGQLKLNWSFPPSKLPQVKTDQSDFATGFFDTKKKMAWIKIDKMMIYREHFESVIKERPDIEAFIYTCYKQFNNNKTPNNVSEAIAGIPSATAIFRQLMIEMKDAKTESLLIDLTHNHGGHSLMAAILVYYLYGKDRVIQFYKGSYDIIKYSELYLEKIKETPTGENEGRLNDQSSLNAEYDFGEEDRYLQGKHSEQEVSAKIGINSSETFKKEWEEGTYSAFYLPENVMVITSTETYSDGFQLLLALSKNKAVTIGTPPGQSIDHFEDKLNFELKHSRIGGVVSSRYSIMFPDETNKDKIFKPDFILSYSQMKKYQFDPHSRLLYALELLKDKKKLKKIR